MPYCFNLKTFPALFFGIFILAIGCGKKTETKDWEPTRYRPSVTEIESYLAKQNVTCEGNQPCPTYIAKIVVIDGDEYKFCTGFLIGSDTLATSTTCLPSNLRLSGQNCSMDIFVFFPMVSNRPAQRVNCKTVLQVSQLEGSDPILWHDNVSFLRLSSSVPSRRVAKITPREGVPDGRQYTSWMIDQLDDYSAVVKKGTCEALHNNYANPLVTNESSPGMIFGDCPVTNGSTGAPVTDSSGKVRAMISQVMNPKVRAYLESTGLLTQGLKEMFHATNFACAVTLDDNDMVDERECLKALSETKLDKLRYEMLSTNVLFSELRKKLEDSIINISKHVQFGVKLVPHGDVQEAVIYPKCFKPFDQWLASLGNRNIYVGEVKMPFKSFKRTMDRNGRVQTITLEEPAKKYYAQYSLKHLRSVGKSSILMWTGNEEVQTFPNISENCSDLLL